MKKWNVLSNFWLKIVAIVTMTLDHIGFFMVQYYSEGTFTNNLGTIFRVLGRFALPLFVFIAVEGAIHTKSIRKYIMRLSAIMFPIMIFQIIAQFGFNSPFYQGNIFIDLIFGVVIVYSLESKNKKWRFILPIPIILGLLSLFCFSYESAHKGTMIWWYPYFLRTQYDIFSILLFLVFYASYKIVPYLLKQNGLNPTLYQESNFYRIHLNITSVVGLVVISSIQYAIGTYIFPLSNGYLVAYWNVSIQFYCVFAAIFIILYNGRRGYNAKWFNVASYLYYPAHLIIIYLLFMMITNIY
jgi:hypothetical protein